MQLPVGSEPGRSQADVGLMVRSSPYIGREGNMMVRIGTGQHRTRTLVLGRRDRGEWMVERGEWIMQSLLLQDLDFGTEPGYTSAKTCRISQKFTPKHSIDAHTC